MHPWFCNYIELLDPVMLGCCQLTMYRTDSLEQNGYHDCLLVCSRNRRHELDTLIPVNSLWNKEELPASRSSQLYLSSGVMPV